MNRRLKLLHLPLLLAVFAATAGASLLNGDPNAVISGTTGWFGEIPGGSEESLIVRVDYAVYEGSNYGYGADEYVYAYQVFNDAPVCEDSFNQGSVDVFSVSIAGGVNSGNDCGTLIPLTGQDPSYSDFFGDPVHGAGYVFFGSDEIEAGSYSSILYYVGLDDYSMDATAIVTNNGRLPITHDGLPTPMAIPEPASASLLLVGSAALMRWFRKRRAA